MLGLTPEHSLRALHSELHEALEKRCETLEDERLLDRSAAALRAALTQPEPVAPTDEEIIAFWSEHCAGDGDAGILRLARWGTPANNTRGAH